MPSRVFCKVLTCPKWQSVKVRPTIFSDKPPFIVNADVINKPLILSVVIFLTFNMIIMSKMGINIKKIKVDPIIIHLKKGKR